MNYHPLSSLRELTPTAMQCGIGSCPAIFELTPRELDCGIGGCPSIYRDAARGDYLVIGKLEDAKQFEGLERRVGEGEVLIRVPKGLIDGMKPSRLEIKARE